MRFGKTIVLAGLLTAAMFCSNAATAAPASDNPAARPVVDQMIEKLGRGVANVAFGPLELLIRPYDISNNEGNIAALTYGVFKGIAYTVARELVGVTDIVTFYMPLPDCTWDPLDSGWGYGPIMRPAWVVGVENNAFNFFFNEQTVVEAR